jgi:hypothetical protein
VRTFIAVVAGFCLTTMLILAGEWGFTMASSPGVRLSHSSFAFFIALLSLAYVGIAVIIGGYLSARIDDSAEAVAGFSVLQLFFGVWFFREFWTTGYVWYKPVALFLIIPCAMLARYWARRSQSYPFHENRTARQTGH